MIEDLSDYGQQNVDEDEEREGVEGHEGEGSSDNLVKAIRSLERTINIHCKLLNRKLGKNSSKIERPRHTPQPPLSGVSTGLRRQGARADKVGGIISHYLINNH